VADPGTTQLQLWVDRLNAGDPAARDALIAHACERLRRLVRVMLRGFPGVHAFEETDDVAQNVIIRLMRRLEAVQVPTAAEFFRLAARETRRELISLARHYGGGAAPARPAGGTPEGTDLAPVDALDTTHMPDRLAVWTEYHEHVEALPDDERAVFDLLWYEGMSQMEAAAALGVPRGTVQRAWLSARLRLQNLLQDDSVV